MNTLPQLRATAPPLALFVALLAALLLASCGGATGGAPPAEATTAAAGDVQLRSYPAGAAAPTAAPAPTSAALIAAEATAAPGALEPTTASAGGGAVAGSQPEATAIAPGAISANDPSRKIIKNADLSLEVANVQRALGQISDIAAQSGGYVLETRTDYGQPQLPQATVRMAVPVDQFEVTLQRIREAAGRVISEQASGVDVTQEFVDVQSQLANLEATEARIREFLKQATTVEEALKVNAQLTEIEGQINVLKGRINFLSQRAAYSTISVQLQQPPPPTPTPSPIPSPTPTPTPTPLPTWDPGKTAGQATSTLALIVQALATVAIWLAIVVLPLALPVLLILLAIRAAQRRMRRPRMPSEPQGAKEQPS
jgi:Domain of unknown function (DUF4349)